MEEDKDLEILQRICQCRRFSGVYSDIECIFEAIENLIARYKELEECLKAEESYSKSLNNDIKSLLYIEPNDNFIPKSKVQEKIEDLEKRGYFEEANAMKDLLED